MSTQSANFVYAINKEDLSSDWQTWLSDEARKSMAKYVRDYYFTKTLAFLNEKDYTSIAKLEGLMDFHTDLMQGINN